MIRLLFGCGTFAAHGSTLFTTASHCARTYHNNSFSEIGSGSGVGIECSPTEAKDPGLIPDKDFQIANDFLNSSISNDEIGP